jgi:hypothetical protein
VNRRALTVGVLPTAALSPLGRCETPRSHRVPLQALDECAALRARLQGEQGALSQEQARAEQLARAASAEAKQIADLQACPSFPFCGVCGAAHNAMHRTRRCIASRISAAVVGERAFSLAPQGQLAALRAQVDLLETDLHRAGETRDRLQVPCPSSWPFLPMRFLPIENAFSSYALLIGFVESVLFG